MAKVAKQKLLANIEQETLHRNWQRYRGSIVMVVGSNIFATKRAGKVNRIVSEIEKKFHRRPLITYIPKEQALAFL